MQQQSILRLCVFPNKELANAIVSIHGTIAFKYDLGFYTEIVRAIDTEIVCVRAKSAFHLFQVYIGVIDECIFGYLYNLFSRFDTNHYWNQMTTCVFGKIITHFRYRVLCNFGLEMRCDGLYFFYNMVSVT